MLTKLVHAQTVLRESELLALKTLTGERTTKESVAKAIEHYLECTAVRKAKS